MYPRRLIMSLKPDSASQLARVAENEIIPLLRKQKGFRDVVTSLAAERSQEAASDSYGETKEDAEVYHRTGHQESFKSSIKVVVGFPKVDTFESSNSTFHEIAAKAA